jgi:putative SOS response-associated peptidase YedK
MWTSMKRRKRCVVVCQGFYEWLKKGPGGKEKVPHYTKRKAGGLMWFAGLWDCVQYEGLFFPLSSLSFRATTNYSL